MAGAIGCYETENQYPKIWRNTAIEWFDKISGYISDYNFSCIDPTRFYEYGKDYHKSEREVMLFDLRKVKSANIVLVNLKDIEKSPRTIDEVFYSWMNGIPIIGFWESSKNEDSIELHPWIKEQTDRIETGENATKKAMIYIRDYYGELR